MPFLPRPDQLPGVLRKTARTLLPAPLRATGARALQSFSYHQHAFSQSFRQNRKRLKSIENRHRGETCIIMGNGPSLAATDFTRIEAIATFGLNRGYLLWNARGFKPTYFACVNELVIEQFADEIAGEPMEKFLPWQARPQFEGATNTTFFPEVWQPRFTKGAHRGLWTGGTVTFIAMQLAYEMGFQRVILIGVDHNFRDKGPANAQVVAQTDDLNHFAPDYFGKGTRWNLPDLELSERAYTLAREAFRARGGEIIDATTGGKLTIFPRMSLEQALAAPCSTGKRAGTPANNAR